MPIGVGLEVPIADLDTLAAPTGEDMMARANLDAGKEVYPDTGVEIPRRMVALYNTRTGERILVNVWRKADVLKLKHKDKAYPQFIGKPVFSESPTVEPVRGQVKCFLHPDHPMRAEFNKRGYPACPAGNLASEQDAALHEERTHKSIWAAEQRRKDQARQDKLMELQQQQIMALTAVVTGAATSRVAKRGGRPRKVQEPPTE